MAMKTPKSEVQVLVYTATHKIEGTYFKVPDARLLDDLNARKDFVPLTHVKVFSLTDEKTVLFEAEFMALNRHHVVLIYSPESH